MASLRQARAREDRSQDLSARAITSEPELGSILCPRHAHSGPRHRESDLNPAPIRTSSVPCPCSEGVGESQEARQWHGSSEVHKVLGAALPEPLPETSPGLPPTRGPSTAGAEPQGTDVGRAHSPTLRDRPLVRQEPACPQAPRRLPTFLHQAGQGCFQKAFPPGKG